MKRIASSLPAFHLPVIARTVAAALFLVMAISAHGGEPPVRITSRPQRLVHGTLDVPVTTRPPVVMVELFVNGSPSGRQSAASVTFSVPLGKYIRRLRVRAVGYDADGHVVGADEMVVNDPQPPFRVTLHGPVKMPEKGSFELSASTLEPPGTRIASVEFFVGDRSAGIDMTAPFSVTVSSDLARDSKFAAVTATTTLGQQVHDVFFWGATPGETVDVTLQQIPLSVAGPIGHAPLLASQLQLLDAGHVRPIEALVPAGDLPLHVILLIDSSESMMEELPFVKRAAKEFAKRIAAPNRLISVVGFAQERLWLTGYTSDANQIGKAIDLLRPRGQTHLYDATIEMLFELQKRSGRRALVVLTDGVNQGGDFELDHLIHYARYAGVPVYPIIRNTLLSRLMKFGLRRFDANRYASIARDSGATWFIVDRSEDLPKVYNTIASELQQQYLLAFQSQSGELDQWHPLGLKTSRRDLRLRIPRGYFP